MLEAELTRFHNYVITSAGPLKRKAAVIIDASLSQLDRWRHIEAVG